MISNHHSDTSNLHVGIEWTCLGRHIHNITSIKIIKNEVGCRDDTVPKTVDTRRHCEEE